MKRIVKLSFTRKMMISSVEKAPVNSVPAAAAILVVLALYLFTGRTGSVDAAG